MKIKFATLLSIFMCFQYPATSSEAVELPKTASNAKEGCELAFLYHSAEYRLQSEILSGLSDNQKTSMAVCNSIIKTILLTLKEYPSDHLKQQKVCLPNAPIPILALLENTVSQIELTDSSKNESTNQIISYSAYKALPVSYPCEV